MSAFVRSLNRLSRAVAASAVPGSPSSSNDSAPVRVPRVYHELSTASVLVTERLEGVSVRDAAGMEITCLSGCFGQRNGSDQCARDGDPDCQARGQRNPLLVGCSSNA